MKADLPAQVRALRQGCGLWRNAARALVVLTGADRTRFLNGLVTCDVAALAAGGGVRGFFTDIKGHILADVIVRAAGDRLWLELPASDLLASVAHLEKYIVADRVEVAAAPDWRALSFVGPICGALVAAWRRQEELPDSPWGQIESRLSGREALITADDQWGVPALTIWTPDTVPLEASIERAISARPEPVAEVVSEAIEVVRVEEGAPRFGQDFGPENLPQETGLEDAVSFDKGCYLGQEVVARLHHRGQVARRLGRMRAVDDELPTIGAELFLDGREAGRVTSAVRSPLTGAVSVIAMLQRRAWDEDTELRCGGDGFLRVV